MTIHCNHIWFKEYSMPDYTKFYCMKCLKRTKVNDWGKINKQIIVKDEAEEIVKQIKIKMNWEDNTTGLTFKDFENAIKLVFKNEEESEDKENGI